MIMSDYSKFLIKRYKNWSVFVHGNQSYLGRCVVWCDREDAIQLTDANSEEQEELFIILKELKFASEKAFGGEWFNFSFLGNAEPHLRAHFIPRYSSHKDFEGEVFKDERWGHHYKKPNDNFVTTPEVLEKIRLKMKEHLD
jgi:diadenosine tetraphosphate (Ap4A) HIT family hydrolase